MIIQQTILNLTDIQMNQYDFVQDLISEQVAVIRFPELKSQMNQKSNQKQNNKVLNDFQTFIIHEKQRERQRVQALKKKQLHIGQQLEKKRLEKQTKIKQLKEKQKEDKQSQCTFKPKINTHQKNQRNFKEFLESQTAHTQKIMDKRQNIKKNLESTKSNSETFKPKINNNKKYSVPVFERLYNKNKQNTNTAVNFQQYSFHPQIHQKSKNLQRNQPVDKLLYSDAIRRQQRSKQQVIPQNYEKEINLKNIKYAAQKFIKQYFFSLQQLQLGSSQLDYITFNQLLRSLGFITSEQNSQNKNAIKQRALVHKAYQMLEQYEVNVRNVCVFLLGLLGIYHINPINFYENQQMDPERQFNLQENQGRKLQREFDLLFRNRLSSDRQRKVEKLQQHYSFQPTINKQSDVLAQKHRQKMLLEANQLLDQYPQLDFNIPQNGVVTHTQLLVLHRMVKDIGNQRKKFEQQDKDLQQCTFKPSLVNSLQSSKYESQGNKCFQLYNLHKDLLMKKQLKKSRTSQIDKQCTFMPKINHSIAPDQRSLKQISHTQESIMRMQKGRKEQDQKRNFLSRGEIQKSHNSSVSSIRKDTHHEKTSKSEVMPNLIIDVNMGDKVQQIYIYKGDQHRLHELARSFALTHGLDEESEIKLIELLKIEIQNVLQKIDEGQQSQCDNDY